MKKLLQAAGPKLKDAAKLLARQTLGRLPRPASRFTGRLAIHGGTPVRDLRLRPWHKHYNNTFAAWTGGVRGALRDVFLRGVEGLPQPLAKQFGQQWAEYCGTHYALLLPHGTDALRIALAAVLDHDGLSYGGEVIVPNLSFIASANAALDRRFGLVFVDVDPETLLLDPNRVEEAIAPGKTRAIMPVHLFGQPANMTALREVVQRHGLKIIEDAAQAHGSVWETGPVGSLGDAAAFSFQSFKNLNCGEGGALTTNDEQVFDRAYALHNVGRARVDGERWDHHTLGWNCRPTEYQAALLLERFRVFEQQQERRRGNFFKLRELLAGVACVRPQSIHPAVRRHGVHMFVVRYKQEHCGGLGVDEFLHACGAEGAPLYRGYACTMATQPALQKLMTTRPQYFRLMPTPVADQAVQELVYISQEIFLGTESDMGDIAAAIRKVQSHYESRGAHQVGRVSPQRTATLPTRAR
jgi:dTDP-4-amino-4,6-dideoxygalactose transaminase